MISRDFLKAGHTPTLFAAFLYFDLSFMVWVILGPLGVAIAKDFHLDPAQKGLMVAIPCWPAPCCGWSTACWSTASAPRRPG
jgi:NNP family nitrate/nitrite transporter-like MFS transporter